MDDYISRQAAIDAVQRHREGVLGGYEYDEGVAFVYAAAHNHIIDVIKQLPSAQPEVAKRIVGMSRDGMTMWYQCDMCNEPVDLKDAFCSGCGRRLVDER